MSFIDLQFDEYSDLAIFEFWNKVVELQGGGVRLNLNTETGTVTAVCNEWHLMADSTAIGVRLNAYEVMIRWDRLAYSATPDELYSKLVSEEAKLILAKFKSSKPKSIICEVYTVDEEIVGHLNY